MDGDGKTNVKDHGGATHSQNVPLLTITFDPVKYQCSLGGQVPNTLFAKYMLLMALEALEVRLQNERAEQIAIPDGPMRVPFSIRG